MDSLASIIADEAIRTVVALATTSIAAGLVWLTTLKVRSKRIVTLISNSHRKFVLYYRGDSATEHHKPISFNEDGSIGEGNNNNESTWSVSYGTLNINSSSGDVYSCFKWDKNIGKLVHTNNPKLPSVMGQYIIPLFVPAESTQKVGGSGI